MKPGSVALALAPTACAGTVRGGGSGQACPRTPGQALFEFVNGRREAEGLEPLRIDRRLVAAAMAHARDLASGGVPLGHVGSDGSEPTDRTKAQNYDYARVAENVASGLPSASVIATGWMGSEGHRHNILTPDFRDAGVAYVEAPDPERGPFWVMMYGRLQDGVPQRTSGDYRVRCIP